MSRDLIDIKLPQPIYRRRASCIHWFFARVIAQLLCCKTARDTITFMSELHSKAAP
jgi:hypothetical protein